MPRRTPKLDQFVHDRETLEECVACGGIAVAGEVCKLCEGRGMTTIGRGDEWRRERGLPLKRGPLLPPKSPLLKT